MWRGHMYNEVSVKYLALTEQKVLEWLRFKISDAAIINDF